MPCRIYKLDFQEKNLNLDRARDLEIRGSNLGPGSNLSLENLILYCFITLACTILMSEFESRTVDFVS